MHESSNSACFSCLNAKGEAESHWWRLVGISYPFPSMRICQGACIAVVTATASEGMEPWVSWCRWMMVDVWGYTCRVWWWERPKLAISSPKVSGQLPTHCVMSVSRGARRTSCQGPMLVSYCLACCKKVRGLEGHSCTISQNMLNLCLNLIWSASQDASSNNFLLFALRCETLLAKIRVSILPIRQAKHQKKMKAT